VGCGYFRMKAGQAYSIQSTNFNSGGTFRNFEQCTWKFFVMSPTLSLSLSVSFPSTTPFSCLVCRVSSVKWRPRALVFLCHPLLTAMGIFWRSLTSTPSPTSKSWPTPLPFMLSKLSPWAHLSRFCGDSTPLGTYNSTTNNLKVHFRSDGQANDGGEGFRCYVTCTGYGKQDPVQLSYNSTVCSSSRPLGT